MLAQVGFQFSETGLGIFFMRRFMVLATGYQVLFTIHYLCAVIMIRVVHIIGKTIRVGLVVQCGCYSVAPVGGAAEVEQVNAGRYMGSPD